MSTRLNLTTGIVYLQDTQSALKVDYANGAALTFNDAGFSNPTSFWARGIGVAANDKPLAAVGYAASAPGGLASGLFAGGAWIAEVPAANAASVREACGSLNEAHMNGAAGSLFRGTGSLSRAFQSSSRAITVLRGSSSQAFQQGAGTIFELVGQETLVEVDVANAGAVTYVMGHGVTINDAIGAGWGSAELYGISIDQQGGAGAFAAGVYVAALNAAEKWSFYGVDRINSEAGYSVGSGTPTNGVSAGPFTVITAIKTIGGLVTTLTGS